jgi:hypothetical protein
MVLCLFLTLLFFSFVEKERKIMEGLGATLSDSIRTGVIQDTMRVTRSLAIHSRVRVGPMKPLSLLVGLLDNNNQTRREAG